MTGIGDLPGGDFGSVATGVSGDGRIIIGASAVEKGSAGFRWTTQGGMVPIGGLLPGRSSQLAAVSFDGSRIVGSSIASIEFVPHPLFAGGGYYRANRAAMLWDESHGVRNLNDVLEQEYGLNLAGWQLVEATDISYDGRTVIGNGINPSGETQGWIVRLEQVPEPNASLLFSIGTLWLIVWNHRPGGVKRR
jgi:uncharacterized membrane protein